MNRSSATRDEPGLAALFHPAVAHWFSEEFPGGATEAQRLSWPRLARGESVLLVSPTGTGKTLAAFLVSLDRILRRRLSGDSSHRLSTLYISPLKALDNDIHRNLEKPRDGIRRALSAIGGPAASWETLLTAEVRTGDTSASARTAQLRRPPDVLITTPESLYLMLTGAARNILASVETVILDEVHSVAGNKRGVHLAVSLERLEALNVARGGKPPQRVALSATVSPVETVASFAAGSGRKMEVVVSAARKRLDLTVTSPAADFRDLPDSSAWGPAVTTMVEEVKSRKTTLVFCNNRRLAERVAKKLGDALEIEVPTHHGSIARPVREGIEKSLKAGTLPVLVATGSLELGIDIGHVDAVIQVESPKGIARGLQRVGRSGHIVGEEARGLFVPLYQDDLFESAATVEAMREGAVESTVPPEFPLDVLAQQLVAEAVSQATEAVPATAEELFGLVRRAFPYRNLTRNLFVETLAMLSGKYPRERFAELAPKLVWDRATDRVTPLPGARLSAVVDGGTIGDRGTFSAVLPDRRTTVGELDEEFVYETRVGDVFLLGSRAWRAIEITHSRVVVEDATGQPARMPFWRGEGLGRTGALGERIGRLKRFISDHLEDPSLPSELARRCGATSEAASALAGAVRREVLESGGLSSDQSIVFETFPNDIGDPCITVRSLFGRGVNLPWSLVLASILRDETGVEVEAVASDDGILLRLPGADRELPLARLSRISPAEAKERLVAILPNSPMFGARFRENAQRALLLPRRRGGRRTPFWLQRLKAKDLLETTRSFPDFPIVAETYRDCWHDIWEVERLLDLLGKIERGKIAAVPVSRKTPSPAAASLLFKFIAVYMYEWDAPKAEKSLHALAANRALLGEILGQEFDDGLREEAVEAARLEISRLAGHRKARSKDELLLVFQELGDLSRQEALDRSTGDGQSWLRDLSDRGSIARTEIAGSERFVLAEEVSSFSSSTAEAEEERIARFLSTRGPVAAVAIATRYGIPEARVEAVLERLRLEGRAVSGRFASPSGERLWASSRLAEIIRRKSLALLRNEIRPVPVAVYREFLAERQGAAPGYRFSGSAAAEHAVAILRGLSLPLMAWETALLPCRVADAEPDGLDLLSARGLLVWRTSAVKDLKSARLELFFRGEGHLFLEPAAPALESLQPQARQLYEALALSGASFVPDLCRLTGQPPEMLRELLADLVRRGLVTGDGLLGLRQLLHTARRTAKPADASVPSGSATLGRHPGRTVLRTAEARVAGRLGLGPPARGRPTTPSGAFDGRWSLVTSPAVMGPEAAPGEREETWARLLLVRWGVVSRETLEREARIRWSDVAPVYARMELAGDVRRGEFIEGHGPIQYAAPDTVEALRKRRDSPPEPSTPPAPVVVCGVDPVLFGCERSAASWVALEKGDVIFELEDSGRFLMSGTRSDTLIRSAFSEMQAVLRRSRHPLGRPRRLRITTAGEKPVVGTPIAVHLQSLGFSRDGDGYSWRAL